MDTVKARSMCTTARCAEGSLPRSEPYSLRYGKQTENLGLTHRHNRTKLSARKRPGPFPVDVMAWGAVGCWHLGGLGSPLDGLPAALQQRPPGSRPCCLTHTHTHTIQRSPLGEKSYVYATAAALSAENNHQVLPS